MTVFAGLTHILLTAPSVARMWWHGHPANDDPALHAHFHKGNDEAMPPRAPVVGGLRARLGSRADHAGDADAASLRHSSDSMVPWDFRVSGGRLAGQGHVVFPPGDLSFLHGIIPIETKFAGPLTMGPSGQPNRTRGRPFAATIWFKFGS